MARRLLGLSPVRSFCPYCKPASEADASAPTAVRYGSFVRLEDRRLLRRFRCLRCKKTFSEATSDRCFGQKKRRLNEPIFLGFCSGMSLRRLALLLHISRQTVARKLVFLGAEAEQALSRCNAEKPQAQAIVFDDMETFEHTKLKPLSITLAVTEGERRILGFEVSEMAANGKLAALSVKKYGKRKDGRRAAREALFERIKPWVAPGATVKSDENPHYGPEVKRWFPKSPYVRHKGRRGSVVGQGELKKIGFDPLFSLNHTCAMLRANVNRLFRRTWCTTKKRERLAAHLALYAHFHNEFILAHPTTAKKRAA